ncbi:MAG: hypothetical protein A2603_07665 [Bdellovibrionales bacterium RIFOXYD1_FULL_55_31]|nr:MAG: hypothetical protein A2603_07665 [Bdellovibrionales bacterium RIFOXYD1_FULL_55_31]
MREMSKVSKYALYERSVQSPASHADWFRRIFREIRAARGKPGPDPEHLREDFCGTFLLSCEWVKSGPRKTAVGVDLDHEPLIYGKRNHFARLSTDEKNRIRIVRRNVLSSKNPGKQEAPDLITACNFSVFEFKERQTLVRYFRNCKTLLNDRGILILEVAGGPGMIENSRETKKLKHQGTPFTYVWDQRSFDPITRQGHFSIHFRFGNARVIDDAFTYHWRLWTIPELRDALIEAGFKGTCVYWETAHEGEGTGEFIRTDQGDNAYSWIAYVVGIH